ncbi:MAG: hypothetical protein NTY02_16390 [Acidobacteria bacterium]|nr:hypothetical protein [Acidobacteriota bacterium]
MNTSLPPTEPAPAPGVGRIVAGLSVIIVWACAHVVLFFLLGASGVIMELFLMLLKAVMFPGASQTAIAPTFAWDWMLKLGTILAGAAGVPAGLAVMWRHRRKALLRYFWLLLLAGIVCEVIAFGTFISGALSTP